MLTSTEAGVGAAGGGAGAGAFGSGAGAGVGAGAGAGGSSRVVSLPPVDPGVVAVPSTDGEDGIDIWLQLAAASAHAITTMESTEVLRMAESRSKANARAK